MGASAFAIAFRQAARGAAVLAGLMLLASSTFAQEPFRLAPGAEVLDITRSILRNEVAVLQAHGDSLWVGPYLNLTTDGGQTWQVARADSLGLESRNRVLSLDVEGPALWAGLGFGAFASGAASAGGFLVSTDGGETFAYRLPHLDTGTEVTMSYGASVLRALPVVAPEGSPPFAIDFDPAAGTVWTAGVTSGIRFSEDGGRTWQRAILPPDTLDAIQPTQAYDFTVAPPRAGGANPRGYIGFLNYVGYSVLVDGTGTVWAGTAAGLNRSRPEDMVIVDGKPFRAWERFDARAGLASDQVIALGEQPLPGHNALWVSSLQPSPAVSGVEDQQRGVTFTRDGGQTFETTLSGERINDFAFRGDTVYAAGTNGVFVLGPEGEIIERIPSFSVPEENFAAAYEVFAVATTSEALWAGTADGLFKSTNGGQTWQAFRAEVPLRPEEPTEQVPRVETYAYPNPFSPAAAPSGRVRIVVEVAEAREVEVRLFDFGMNLVRQLTGTCRPGGNCEIPWDGTDEVGRRVANGVYFYTADLGEETVRGKIMVLR